MRGCRPLTESEFDQLIEALRGPNRIRTRALLLLGLKTGFRVSELLSLKIGDLFVNGRPVKEVEVQRRNMKGGKAGRAQSRRLLLHPATHPFLIPQWEDLKRKGYWRPDCYFFQSRSRGNRPINRKQAWKDIVTTAREIGLEGRIGTHGPMRKTFTKRKLDYLTANWVPGKEVPFITLQRLTGHKTQDALMHYIPWADDGVNKALLNS